MNEFLKDEITRVNDAIEWAKAGIAKAPEGSLIVDQSGTTPRYYWRKNQAENKGSYLGKGDESLTRALAQKGYEQRLLAAAEKEKARLEKVAALYEKGCTHTPDGHDALAEVYDNLPGARKVLVESFDIDDEEYARRWLTVEYATNGHSFGAGGLYSRTGQQLRSKSEVIIADALDAAGVPYRYEQALFIGGYSPAYPDFTVLNKRTHAEFVWEHLGAMDDPDFCAQALDKLNQYALAGYLPGDKLLVTQESSAVPLDTRVVTAIIERYLK